MPALLNEKIKLQNIVCQFHFISAPDEIRQLLQSFPPKISMYDANKGDVPLSLLMLDIKLLFHQEKVVLMLYLQRYHKIIQIKIRFCLQSECQYKLSLFDTDRNKIADMDIVLKLEDRGPHCILKKETFGKLNLLKFLVVFFLFPSVLFLNDEFWLSLFK